MKYDFDTLIDRAGTNSIIRDPRYLDPQSESRDRRRSAIRTIRRRRRIPAAEFCVSAIAACGSDGSHSESVRILTGAVGQNEIVPETFVDYVPRFNTKDSTVKLQQRSHSDH